MLTVLPEKIERGRIKKGFFASDWSLGPNGAFFVHGPCGEELKIIASDGTLSESAGWEHVSVSTRRRVPNWTEMCCVKALFWSAEETVIQLHPPQSEYINNHPFCLHLWKPPYALALPPGLLVGDKTLGVLA